MVWKFHKLLISVVYLITHLYQTSILIANFKSSITNADIMSKLGMWLSANPNDNYKILSDIITTAKANCIPKKLKKKLINVNLKKTTMDMGARRNFSRGGQTFGGPPKNL